MSETFRCDDKEMLVAYLYDELASAGRREVDRHLRTCTACRDEVQGLSTLRRDLQAWTPPDADLGFAIVQKPVIARAAVVGTPRWAALRDLPAWAQVAAAALVLGVGAALANVQVRSGSEGLVVTTGWLTPAPAAAPAAAAPAEAPEWRHELASLEASLRREIADQRSALRAIRSAPSSDDAATAAVLRRVQAMIEASEERQRRDVAMRLTMAERSWTQRRSADWATITQRMSTLQGRTFAVEAGQQEMINRLRRASLTTPNQ